MKLPGSVVESIEALSWLEDPDGKERTISEDSDTRLWPEESPRLVHALYDAGATEVLVQGVYVEEDFEDATSIRVVLPQDPKARAALFAIEARALRDMDSPFDPEGERGQSSFMLGW